MWAAASSAAVLGVGLFLPLWKRARIVGCRVCYESMPVWRGLTSRRTVDPAVAGLTRDDNRNVCLGLLAVAGGVGAVVYWVRRPRIRLLEEDDYSDGPDGSVPDGRVAR
jgi:hypothetical protein